LFIVFTEKIGDRLIFHENDEKECPSGMGLETVFKARFQYRS